MLSEVGWLVQYSQGLQKLLNSKNQTSSHKMAQSLNKSKLNLPKVKVDKVSTLFYWMGEEDEDGLT